MGEGSCLSHFVNCYCVSPVTLGRFVTVSQYTFLCTASHDFRKRGMPLIAAPITIGDHAWVTADAFIGPGVSVGEGAVVGARAVVVGDVPEWTVVAGHPARVVGSRPRDAI
jgi:putative colanic acid biosynthesis acetyltransferase WcaF